MKGESRKPERIGLPRWRRSESERLRTQNWNVKKKMYSALCLCLYLYIYILSIYSAIGWREKTKPKGKMNASPPFAPTCVRPTLLLLLFLLTCAHIEVEKVLSRKPSGRACVTWCRRPTGPLCSLSWPEFRKWKVKRETTRENWYFTSLVAGLDAFVTCCPVLPTTMWWLRWTNRMEEGQVKCFSLSRQVGCWFNWPGRDRRLASCPNSTDVNSKSAGQLTFPFHESASFPIQSKEVTTHQSPKRTPYLQQQQQQQQHSTDETDFLANNNEELENGRWGERKKKPWPSRFGCHLARLVRFLFQVYSKAIQHTGRAFSFSIEFGEKNYYYYNNNNNNNTTNWNWDSNQMFSKR